MAEKHDPQTVDDYPGLFYHRITNPDTLATMDAIRLVYLRTAEEVLHLCPMHRYRSLALTDLEASLLRAIQCLAVQDPEAKETPALWKPPPYAGIA